MSVVGLLAFVSTQVWASESRQSVGNPEPRTDRKSATGAGPDPGESIDKPQLRGGAVINPPGGGSNVGQASGGNPRELPRVTGSSGSGSTNQTNIGGGQPTSRPGVIVVNPPDFDLRTNTSQIATEVAKSSWFALISGVASILGLLLAQYGTQVKPLPYSLYRSFVWRKALILAAGVGLYVSCCVGFYYQETPLIPLLAELHGFVHGRPPFSSQGYGTPLWTIGIGASVIITVLGARYDPLKTVMELVLKEEHALRMAEEVQTARRSDATGKTADNESERQRDDVTLFYRELRFRLIDLAIGAPSGQPLFERWAREFGSDRNKRS